MKNTKTIQARPPKQTMFEYQQEMRKQAIETAQKFKDIKPTKYLLK